MKASRRTFPLLCAVWLGGLPLAAAAHLLDGSPDPLPGWVAVAGLAIVGVMGGAVGFAINKHRQSMELQKKQRQQRAAGAANPPATASSPESAP